MAQNNLAKGKKNAIVSVMSEIVILILGLIVPRLFIINYGSEVNGLVHSTAQFLQYLTIFEAGIGAVMTKSLYKPLTDNDKDKISMVYNTGNRYYLKMIPWYVFSLLIISLIYCFTVDTTINRVTVFLVVLLSGLSNALVWAFVSAKNCLIQADGHYYFVSVVRLLITCLTYIAQIISIYFNASIVVIKLIGLLVTLTQIVAYNIFFFRKYTWIDKKKPCDMQLFSDRKYYFLHQIARLFFSCTDMVLLTYLCSLSMVSVYSAYNMIITGINTVLSMLISSVLFILGQTYQQCKEKYFEVHDTFKMFYMLLAFSLASTAYMLYYPFMSIYIGNVDVNYKDKILAFLFSGICMLNSTRAIDDNLASFAGYAKETLPLVWIEVIINVVLSVVLVFKLGIYGVLIGTMVAILYRYFSSIIYTEKHILKRSLWKGFTFSIVDFIGFAIVFNVDYFIEIQVVSWTDFFIKAVCICAGIFCIYVLLNLLFFKKKVNNAIQLLRRNNRYEPIN